MNQANNVLDNIYQPDLEMINPPEIELQELSIEIEEEDLLLADDGEIDDFLDPQSDEDDTKSGKAAKSRPRAQTKKKQYTDDS
ncbi:MAG: RNA polymerase sigma factor, RpoD/SigA family, partial [Dolichospermum sp.]